MCSLFLFADLHPENDYKAWRTHNNKSVSYQPLLLLSVLCFYPAQRSVERQDEHTEDECMWKTEGTKMILRCVHTCGLTVVNASAANESQSSQMQPVRFKQWPGEVIRVKHR